MCLPVGLPQPIGGDVGVQLGRGQGGVTQQFLDRPEVCPALEEMGRSRVPQAVGSDVGSARHVGDPAVHELAYDALVDPTPAGAEEHGWT